ncbi:MAG: VWA domain-containing protein [bacterium]|nr:VWA domain-containing protein [bacterium]
MMRHCYGSAVVATALLAVLHGSNLPASETEETEPTAQPGGFGETVHVNVVNVEVYVTDKRGDPVRGLVAADFEVSENRKPMEITNFYAVEGGDRVAETMLPEVQPASRPASVSALEPVEMAEDERLRLVVYVDNFNLRPLDRMRVASQLRLFLERNLGPEDRVMLVSNDRSLHLRHPFTSDPTRIADALKELEQTRADGGRYDVARRRVIRELDQAETSMQAMSQIRPFADQVYHDLNTTIDTLREAVDILAGLPGRKVVLHVSSGLPMIPAGDLFSAVEQKFEQSSAMSERMSYDTSRRFEELGAQANAHAVTFYTLDAAGLRIYGSKTAEEEGLDDDRMAQRIDSDFEANVQEPLYFLADRTGGRAIVNQNEVLAPLERIANDFRTYYSLGYTPSHHGDGHFYNIHVKVKRKGVQVRHREGYRDKNTDTRMADGTRAALLHSVETNPLDLELVLGRESAQGESQFMVPIQVKIPVSRLVLLPREEDHVGRIRLFVAALDEKGGMSEVQDTYLGINIPSDSVAAARSEFWLFTHQVLMESGRQKLAIGVRDELGGVEAFVSRAVRVGG